MNNTLFFDRTHEAKQAEKWRRRNVKLEVVSLRFGEGEGAEWREREIHRYCDLGTYQRILTDSDDEVWIIGHIPTGYQVGPEFASKRDAVLFMYLVRDLDWSFTRPSEAPLEGRLRLVREAAVNACAIYVPEDLEKGGAL